MNGIFAQLQQGNQNAADAAAAADAQNTPPPQVVFSRTKGWSNPG